MPRLVPGISIRWAQCLAKRDGRDKPGHDESKTRPSDNIGVNYSAGFAAAAARSAATRLSTMRTDQIEPS